MNKGKFEYKGKKVKYKIKIETHYNSLKLICISKLGEFRLIPYEILIDHNYIPFLDINTIKEYVTNREFVEHWSTMPETHMNQIIQAKLESEIDSRIKCKEYQEYHNKVKQFNK